KLSKSKEAMEKTSTTTKKKEITDRSSLIDLVFSWSLRDVLNNHLYKNQVPKIPETFSTVTSYKKSFIPSLIEETHADLLSNMMTLSHAPTCEILTLEYSKHHKPPKALFYDITYKKDTEVDKNHKGPMYEPQVGDLIALTNVKPKCIDDLNRPQRFYLIAYVNGGTNLEKFPDDFEFKILSSKPIGLGEQDTQQSKRETLFAVYLMNMTTNIRVWDALNSEGENKNVIEKVLQPNSDDGSSCTVCFPKEKCSPDLSTIWPTISSHSLNESQEAAILNCISLSKCQHQNAVKLIWGPPGTGKTKTVSLSLFALFKLKCRTLTCAPTNIAVLEVAARLRRLVNHSLEYGKYGLGDIILFGNKKRMKVDGNAELLDVFLDHRAKTLYECLVPLSGWKHLLESMICLLEDPDKQYSLYLEKEVEKHKENAQENKKDTNGNAESVSGDDPLTFEEYMRREFDSVGDAMKFCMLLLNDFKGPGSIGGWFTQLRKKCVCKLKLLPQEFSGLNSISINEFLIKQFCLQNACLIFCTASTSAKLDGTAAVRPLELLVIDEAAQLKECESAIPLQLSGIRHAILIGDERQLPAMVKSKVSAKAEFGRSLFERLAGLGHAKHLLNIQYRMHPSISLFPNREFYDNQILDGPNVNERSYERCFLQGKKYQSYSFINVANGKDEFDHGHSRKNMVEVAVVSEIVASLYKDFTGKRKKVSVGVISPYKAQVHAIQERVKNYSKDSDAGFSVSVRSVDGFQGGEEDLVLDAERRECFHNADEDNNLALAIAAALLELGQLHSLLNIDSFLFKNARWKVCFTSEFQKSLAMIKDTVICREVGWRRAQKDKGIIVHDGTCAQLLEKYKVNRLLNLIWTVDILQQNSEYVQVMKVWDIVTRSDVPKLAKRLDIIIGSYTVDKMNRCKHKCVERETTKAVKPLTQCLSTPQSRSKSRANQRRSSKLQVWRPCIPYD
ncbi:P-loop containing nucleoside triphosphate hydrolases superfamily protein, partial [Prunus dulcis]